ncbi:MAG TPA: AMP-binding protein, partial [Kineosporiaceae bacterium]|nr:AMP-binding protein [Kineosporiaceae bacterium]
MLEISVPALVPPDPQADLTDLVADAAREDPGCVLFGRPTSAGWEDVTASAFLAEVTRLAKGLVAAGVRPGDRVALMSKTRYEWTLSDVAVWFAGAVTVPVYETSSAEQVAWILGDSGAVGIVVETPAHAATVESVRGDLAALRSVWTVDEGGLEHLAAGGADVDDAEIEARRAGLNGDSVATLIYTSGTTGRPKGCELTHANFRDLALNATTYLSEVVRAPGASTLLFLPLAHVFARFVQVLCIAARARLGHTPDVKNLLDDLAAFRPTFVLAVPRVFEKIYNSSEARAEAGGKGRIFAGATAAAVAWSEAQDAGSVPFGLRVRHAVFDKLVYGKLREA